MFQAIESNNNSFGCAGAAAGENDVEWVITLESALRRGFTKFRKLYRLLWRKDQRRLGDG